MTCLAYHQPLSICLVTPICCYLTFKLIQNYLLEHLEQCLNATKQTGKTSTKTLMPVSRLWIYISPEIADGDPSPVEHINMIWQRWRDKLMDAAVRHILTKIVKRRNTPLWFDSQSSRHRYKRKETARRKAKRTSKPNDLEHFRNLRRSLKTLVARKRKKLFQSFARFDEV